MSTEENPDNGSKISYTTKELVNRMDAKLDMLVGLVATKADASVLNEVSNRVTKLEADADYRQRAIHRLSNELVNQQSRQSQLERESASQSAVNNYRRWVFGTLGIGVVAIALQVIGLSGFGA